MAQAQRYLEKPVQKQCKSSTVPPGSPRIATYHRHRIAVLLPQLHSSPHTHSLHFYNVSEGCSIGSRGVLLVPAGVGGGHMARGGRGGLQLRERLGVSHGRGRRDCAALPAPAAQPLGGRNRGAVNGRLVCARAVQLQQLA